MDINDMDKLLSRAKMEADKFFRDYSDEIIGKAVYSRIRTQDEHNQSTIYDISRKNKILRRTVPAAIIACTLLVSLSVFFFSGILNQKKIASLGEPVSQEMIKLNESDSSQLLDYFKINKPEQTGDSLLAVIWDSEHDGQYEMVYSSLFENSDQPGPILMIYFPHNQPDMAVISSENKDMQYIHYRVVGYSKNQITTLMEKNYIDGGEIEVQNGVLKETRLVPGFSDKIVTHYIPYQLNESGDIISSLQNIKINTGEYVTFIGNTSDPVEVSYSNLFSEWECGLITTNNDNKILYAESFGHEELSIKPVNGSNTETITIEIIEN